MPLAVASLGTGLVTSTFYPYSITVGWNEINISAQLDQIKFEENADADPGYAWFRVYDPTNSFDVLPGMPVFVVDNTAGAQVFLGTVLTNSSESEAIGRFVNVQAVSASAMLDSLLVPNEPRQAETDQARVQYLWGVYARFPLSDDTTQVSSAVIVPADLMSGMTLRAALDQTAGLAGGSTHYHIDALGRLVWRSGGSVTTAPFAINTTLAPPGGSIAPESLLVERDGTITNRVYIRGATTQGTGWWQDDGSVNQYGPREDYIDAPSADTSAKARNIAQLQLGRVAQPNIRATFVTRDPRSGWRADQNVTITSPADDLSAQVLRIVKVTTEFWRGDGQRQFTVDAGKTGARLSGVPTAQDVGNPAFIVRNRLMFMNDNGVVGPGYIAGSPNGGLLIVSNDGSSVIIDGTSDMFKIAASGSVSSAIPAVSGTTLGTATVTTSFPGLGTLPFTPGHQSYVASAAGTGSGRSQSPLTQYYPGTQFVAGTSGGVVTNTALVPLTTGYLRTYLSAGIAQIDFVLINAAGATTYYGYFYILQETAI
jgi:hypothetical protein